MRIHQIKGILVNDIRKDTTSKMNEWILNHEFRVTYRDSLLDSEELLEGTWTGEIRQGEPILISISDNIAEDANLEIGDQIVFNVQGVLMETTVGSIRKVDWGQYAIEFFYCFSKRCFRKCTSI